MEFSEIFTMLGLETATVLSIGTIVYGAVALLRSELPSNWTKGWKSRVIGAVLSLGLAYKAVPFGGADIIIFTAAASWMVAMFPAKLFKGTKLEIARNGTAKQ